MSLQVWLPLNNDTRNIGCKCDSIPNFTSTNSSIIDGGKLGKCLKTIDVIDLNYAPNFNTKSISFGGWFKFNKSEIQTAIQNLSYTSIAKSATGNLIGNDNYNGIGLIWVTNDMYSNNKVLTNIYVSSCLRTTTVSNYNTTFTDISFDVWTHIYLTYNSSTRTLSFYKNGVLIESKVIASFNDGIVENLMINKKGIYGGNGPASYIPFYINDVRIYNHCLSVKEVKNLAKGLMLHYTLSRPCDNLLVNTSNYLNATQSKPNKDGWLSYPMYANNLSAGDYIYSIRVTKGTLASGHTTGGVDYTKGYWTLWTYTSATPYSNSDYSHYTQAVCYTSGNLLGRIGDIYYWKITISSSYPNLAVRINTYSDGTNDATINFGQLKLEKYSTGVNKPTPWIPNSADTLYSAMGLNSTRESDVTGYRNNGTRVNITTRESDTPRYLSCIYFNGTGTRINLPAITFTGASNSYTFSWWSKSGSSGMFWGFGDGNRLNLYMATNLYWNTGDGSNNPFYSSGTTVIPATTYGNNVWHHYAITGDGTTVTLYVDGNKAGTAKTYKGITGTQIYINGWDTGTSYKFNGRMSDFRIYATALSADDVKELYNVGASVDRNGNMHCYELVEV